MEILVTSIVIAFLAGASPSLPSYIIQVDGKAHLIFITVDDHPASTSMAMLKVLKRCKIKATFFILGSSEWYYRKNPKWGPLKRLHQSLLAIYKDGHVLGNHTVKHSNLCKLKRSKVRWELRTTQWLVKKATGVTLKYWRPPFLVNCLVARQEARKLKLKFVGAHVGDLRGSARKMWFRVRLRAQRGKKSTIILFHKNVKKLKAFLKLSGLCPLPTYVRPRSR